MLPTDITAARASKEPDVDYVIVHWQAACII
jgi:hypothetical protein